MSLSIASILRFRNFALELDNILCGITDSTVASGGFKALVEFYRFFFSSNLGQRSRTVGEGLGLNAEFL